MIVEFGQGKYYLYRHIRLDKNEVFYIGIGSKYVSENNLYINYSRAYNKSSRNRFWKNIINITNYEVEILLESDDLSFIKQKEKEFIKLYGRKDLKEGSLSNLTDGGEYEKGYICSTETRKKISNSKKGKKSKKFIEFCISRKNNDKDYFCKKRRKIYQFDTNYILIKEWSSVSVAEKHYTQKEKSNNILSKYAVGLNNHMWYGYYWSYSKEHKFEIKQSKKYTKETIEKTNITKRKKSKKLIVTSKTNNLSVIWNSIYEFVQYNPEFNTKMIYQTCSQNKKSYRGFLFSYLEDNVKSN